MRKSWISSAHQGCVKDGMHSNTLSSFILAAGLGADMIETDARATSDGVIVANHDPVVRGIDCRGNKVEYTISETPASVITSVILAPDDPRGVQYVPTLEQVLDLCYYTGMLLNIDLKEGLLSAEEIARTAVRFGMKGRVVYATNGSGPDCIHRILKIDSGARFIDTPANFTAENLSSVEYYDNKCFAYTGDFSPENISRIRASGCMLAAIGINSVNAADAFKYHPEMAEYPHTSDFASIDSSVISSAGYNGDR